MTYWNTACLEPEIEAVSKEIATLAAHFSGRVFGVSRHYLLRVAPAARTVGVNAGFDPLLRLVIPLLELGCDISHVYGEPSPWIFHKTLRRRPIVLTVASEKGGLVNGFLARCRRIVTQTESFRARLIAAGVKPDRVEVIFPGVDLERFAPAARPPDADTPRLLFATAPRSAQELAGRGVPLLLDAARHMPRARVHMLFRHWASGYTSLEPTRAMIVGRGLDNVELTDGVEPDMAAVYGGYHFTVIPYTTPDGGKECPNSVVEGMACGVPVLISRAAPFAEFVVRHGCGEVFDPEPDALARAVERGMSRWPELAARARNTARMLFSEQRMLARYRELYEACLDEAR
ncbi:MAG: glycosyltransferase family 4 protein [Nitrospirae bacterium]|nr:glycosyltransferase family 4 protein [Nitrospirota bacterium]